MFFVLSELLSQTRPTNIRLVLVYRSPKCVKADDDKLIEIIHDLVYERNDAIILGDFSLKLTGTV